MKLTHLFISKKAKPADKDFQLADGQGLSLVVRSGGEMVWLYEYRVEGKKVKLRLGHYPDLSLAEAREKHQATRKLVRQGICPKAQAEADKAAARARENRLTFAEAAERYRAEWLVRNWKDPSKPWGVIQRHLIPAFGAVPVEEIAVDGLRLALYDLRSRKGEAAALEAHGAMRRILDYGVEHGWLPHNVAAAIAPKRIGTRKKRVRYLRAQEIRRYLAELYQSSCYRGYKLGLNLLLMLGLRLNELAGAAWSEIDLERGEWVIPAARMKGKREHWVFLPPQALEMFLELRALAGGSAWVFPMRTDPARAMDGNNLGGVHRAICAACGLDDYHIHDHRHTASTHLHEMGYPADVIEAALAHAIRGLRGVYSHAEYREQRAKMLAAWADHLDGLMSEATVIRATFRKTA
ncbi:tyrosine-type recombinase/integrase [Methylomagnum sp.]